MRNFVKKLKGLNTFQKTLSVTAVIWYIGFLAYGNPDRYLDATLVGMVAFLGIAFIQSILEKRKSRHPRDPDAHPLELSDI